MLALEVEDVRGGGVGAVRVALDAPSHMLALPPRLQSLAQGHHVLVCGLLRSAVADGGVDVLRGSCTEMFETLHNLSCLLGALRSPHLVASQPVADTLDGQCDALRCSAAAVAWRETGSGAEITLDDGLIAIRCMARSHTLAELLDLTEDDLMRLSPVQRGGLLDGLLVRERMWALTRTDEGWRIDCAAAVEGDWLTGRTQE
mmetsp:Transcript_22763/g.61019  ORF Transcript_22763/g.61019 Transcript_22763/m.61019 type:complete len:202 (-) Transcript_22763:327-932(-)